MASNKLVHRHRLAFLDRLLDQPDLVQRMQALEPGALARASRHIGLEDAGELVAMASARQLAQIFDEELWVADEPGCDETFDAARFGLWLSVLLESGAPYAARKLLELDEDFVTMALFTQVLVIDIEALAVSMSSGERDDDDEALEKQLDGTLHVEIEQYRIIAKEPRHWVAVSAILLELGEPHFSHFSRLAERCCDLSSAYIEEQGGLYEVLSEAETLPEDVAGAREERREQLGYVAPSSALAFLRLSAQLADEEVLASTELDAFTRMHLRTQKSRSADRTAPDLANRPERDDTLRALLASAELVDRRWPFASWGARASSRSP